MTRQAARADVAGRRPNRRGAATRESMLEAALKSLASGEPGSVSANRIAREVGADPLVLTADVARPEQVAEATAAVRTRLGRIDILFNNAGISVRKPPQELTPEEWHRVLDVNLTGAFLMAQAVYPAMVA